MNVPVETPGGTRDHEAACTVIDLAAALGSRLLSPDGADHSLADWRHDDAHGMLNGRVRVEALASLYGGPDADRNRVQYQCARFMLMGGFSESLSPSAGAAARSEAAVALGVFRSRVKELRQNVPEYKDRTDLIGSPKCILEEASLSTSTGIDAVVDYARQHNIGRTLIVTSLNHQLRSKAMLAMRLHEAGLLEKSAQSFEVLPAELLVQSWDYDQRHRREQLLAYCGADYASSRDRRAESEISGTLKLAFQQYGRAPEDGDELEFVETVLGGDTDKLYRVLFALSIGAALSAAGEDADPAQIAFLRKRLPDGYKTDREKRMLLEAICNMWAVLGAHTGLSTRAFPLPWYNDPVADRHLVNTTRINLWMHGLNNIRTFELPPEIEATALS